MKATAVLFSIVIVFALACAMVAGRGQEVQQVPEADKKANVNSGLAVLLSPFGVHVKDALVTAGSVRYKEMKVRWTRTDATHGSLVKESGPGVLSVLAASSKSGALQQQRSLDLSTNQILTVAVDADNNLHWWRLMLDPRLVRAEVPDAKGELRSQELFLTDVEFSVDLPDDASITEVQLYRLIWNGHEFQLELVSRFAAS
jgi:hypothetical protein